MNAYFTRPSPTTVNVGEGNVVIASLNVLPAGSYVFLAKATVRTLFELEGTDFLDNGNALFSLKAGGQSDATQIVLWRAQNQQPQAFQPVDVINLQLAATITGPTSKKDAAVKFLANAESGILELVDVVLNRPQR